METSCRLSTLLVVVVLCKLLTSKPRNRIDLNFKNHVRGGFQFID